MCSVSALLISTRLRPLEPAGVIALSLCSSLDVAGHLPLFLDTLQVSSDVLRLALGSGTSEAELLSDYINFLFLSRLMACHLSDAGTVWVQNFLRPESVGLSLKSLSPASSTFSFCAYFSGLLMENHKFLWCIAQIYN